MAAAGVRSASRPAALRECRRLEDSGGVVDVLDALTRLALARGDRDEARLYGERLIKVYLARSQEKEAQELEALLAAAPPRPPRPGPRPSSP